jgi:hypothetical protein
MYTSVFCQHDPEKPPWGKPVRYIYGDLKAKYIYIYIYIYGDLKANASTSKNTRNRIQSKLILKLVMEFLKLVPASLRTKAPFALVRSLLLLCPLLAC